MSGRPFVRRTTDTYRMPSQYYSTTEKAAAKWLGKNLPKRTAFAPRVSREALLDLFTTIDRKFPLYNGGHNGRVIDKPLFTRPLPPLPSASQFTKPPTFQMFFSNGIRTELERSLREDPKVTPPTGTREKPREQAWEQRPGSSNSSLSSDLDDDNPDASSVVANYDLDDDPSYALGDMDDQFATWASRKQEAGDAITMDEMGAPPNTHARLAGWARNVSTKTSSAKVRTSSSNPHRAQQSTGKSGEKDFHYLAEAEQIYDQLRDSDDDTVSTIPIEYTSHSGDSEEEDAPVSKCAQIVKGKALTNSSIVVGQSASKKRAPRRKNRKVYTSKGSQRQQEDEKLEEQRLQQLDHEERDRKRVEQMRANPSSMAMEPLDGGREQAALGLLFQGSLINPRDDTHIKALIDQFKNDQEREIAKKAAIAAEAVKAMDAKEAEENARKAKIAEEIKKKQQSLVMTMEVYGIKGRLKGKARMAVKKDKKMMAQKAENVAATK